MSEYAPLEMLGIDAFCSLIEAGDSQAKIARELGINKSVVTRWLGLDDQRSARVKYSRALSAESLYEQVDDDLRTAADPFELAKAKELGQHRRKWAAIRNPREYGDKITQEHTGADGGPVQTVTRIELVAPEVKG